MKKHTIAERVGLWFWNWRYRRLLPVELARKPFGRNVNWLDLPFVSFGFLWLVAESLLHKEQIPGTVILVGKPRTMKAWDEACEWAEKLEKEHPEWGDK